MAGKHLPQADHRGRRNLLGAGAAISIICAAAFVVPTSSLPLKPALSLGTITQTAYAGERDRDGERSMRHHKRRQENADDEDNSAAVQKPVSGSDSDKGPDSGNKADTQQPCCRPGDLSGPARYPAEMQTSPKSAITYDASKNMLLLRLKLGADERREHGHEHGHEHGLGTLHQDGGRAGHGNAISREMLRALHQGEKAQEHEFGSPRPEGWHPVRSVVALDKTLAPVEKRLHKAVEAANPKTTTSVSKNKFAIAPLSFALDEILGVHLDEASIRRVEALGFKVERGADPLSNAGITRLTVPPGVDAIRARDMLRSQLPGQRFELNRVYRVYRAAVRDDGGSIRRAEPIVQDPSLVCAGDRCAGRKAIQWRDALAPCARGLRVGVIDTGYDAAHPVFEGRRIHQRDFHPENRPAAPQWHGTAVLSILAGKPQSSTPGLIPDAEFFVADVFFTEADGGLATDTASLLSALKWMDESDVRIINMSFSGPRDPIVEEAIGEASGKGVVLVAAAGNEGPNASPAYPAAYKQVIAVTAVSKELRNYRYANRGDHIDVAAPGVDIWAAVPQAQAGYLSGTSFAAPFATAVMSILPDDRLGLPKDELLDSLTFIDLGESGRDPVYGRGLLLAPETCSTPRETVASAAH